MLAADDQMRWWGIDVRSRRRRRLTVSVSYMLLFAAFERIGAHGRWTAHPYLVLLSMIVAALLLGRLSIFGKNGPLKERDRPSLRLAGADFVRVTGLDERAQYRFGVESFEAASEVQKSELLNTYKVGTRFMPKDQDRTLWLDERELRERDNAERWALKLTIILLAALTGTWFSQMADRGKLDGYSVVTLLLYLAFIASTLPKARVLWTDPDPREFGGEIALVERPEGGL